MAFADTAGGPQTQQGGDRARRGALWRKQRPVAARKPVAQEQIAAK
jgi:hypothetical protein